MFHFDCLIHTRSNILIGFRALANSLAHTSLKNLVVNVLDFRVVQYGHAKGYIMKTNNEIDTIHKELQDSISNIYETMTFIEKSEEFQRHDPHLKQYFYHLHVKAIRNFQAINVLINSKDLQNGYVEATVLLRVMTESYLHLYYLMQTPKEQILKEYKELNDLKIKQTLDLENPANTFKTSNKTEEDYIENLRLEYSNKKVKVPIHFRNMSVLADITQNKIVYHAIYEMFNTYVHFNPSTYLSYGTENEDGSFTYNAFERKPYLEARILFFAVNIQMILAHKLILYFKIAIAPTSVLEGLSRWDKFVEEKKPAIFNDTDDYV